MPLDRLSKACRKVVGSKQTMKVIDRNQARVVYVAKNADQHVMEPILKACSENSVPVVYAESMQVLGKACGIEVGCAAAAVVED